MESAFIIEKSVVIVVVFAVTMIMAMYSTWAERKVAAFLQDRVGPNRAGFGGLLQPLADGLKLFSKEEFEPNTPNRFLFFVGPAIAMSTALMTSAVIPWGDKLHLFGRDILLQATDLNIGLLYFFGVVSVGVYGIMIGGWASNNKYSLLGGLRSAAQTISYEVFLGISLMGVVAIAGSFNLREIVEAQRDVWFVIPQFLGFLIFVVAGVAVTHRHPFDQPEAEQELAEGYHVEYGGMKWGMFFVAEYVNVVLISALIVTLFFGGWLAPFNLEIPFVPPVFWFVIKTAFFVMMFVLARGSLMRPRYDQVMNFGWKICLPLALVNLLVTGAVILMNQA